jgi:hypothetical protein
MRRNGILPTNKIYVISELICPSLIEFLNHIMGSDAFLCEVARGCKKNLNDFSAEHDVSV